MSRKSRFLAAYRPLLAAAGFVVTAAAPAQPVSVPVSVALAERITVSDTLRLTGTLTAARHAQLSPRVDGLVAALRVDAGDRVEQGEPLIELDATLARHALERAEASLAEARAALAETERLVAEARRLIAERHVPETELARREADVALARARLAASEAAVAEQAELLRRHALPAPFDGVIARRLTDVGEWVVRGTPVLELVSTDTVWLDVRAPQESYTRFGANAAVEVHPDALPGATFPARVAALVPVSDPNARSFLVRIAIESNEQTLPPGTSAIATIRFADGAHSVAVPRTALRRYPDGSHSVFIIRTADGRAHAHERRVTVGTDNGAESEVLQGLEPGERVVVRGWEALTDGAPVTVQDDR